MTIQITKKQVSLSQEGLYNIILNLKYLDGETVLLDLDFVEKYRTGQTVGDIISRFKPKMQKAIDGYKAEQVIFNAAVFDSAIVTLQNGLST